MYFQLFRLNWIVNQALTVSVTEWGHQNQLYIFVCKKKGKEKNAKKKY